MKTNQLSQLPIVEIAHLVLASLDLTELGDNCDKNTIINLCAKAKGYINGEDGYVDGKTIPSVPAVCVWPKWVETSRNILPANIKIASVVNFPSGDLDFCDVKNEIQTIIKSAGDEVDCVFPYKKLFSGDLKYCQAFLAKVRSECGDKTLKIILESGTFHDEQTLIKACEIALIAGADFLKTSTGKISQGADINSAKIMVQEINKYIANSNNQKKILSLKPSGGLKKITDVIAYMELIEKNWGFSAINPQRFRIGASSIWNDIEEILIGTKNNQLLESRY